MRVHHLDVDPAELAAPDAAAWAGLAAEQSELQGVPIDDQPSGWVRGAYAGGSVGVVPAVEVLAATAGADWLVRLSWDDATSDRAHGDQTFPDAAAIMWPLHPDAVLTTMGSPQAPVALWFWRPDLEGEADELVASGLGTVDPATPDAGRHLSARSIHDGGRWTIVFRRAASVGIADRVDLEAGGGPGRVGFAIWEGSAGERGGFKAASADWQALEPQEVTA